MPPLKRKRGPAKGPDPVPVPVPVGSIIVYTDGSCVRNGKASAKAGFACVFPDHPDLSGGWPLADGVVPTSNRAEFAGFIRAAEIADKIDGTAADAAQRRTLLVVTDSQLLQNCVMRWIAAWRKKGWKKADGAQVANLDMCKKIAEICDKRAVVVKHVKSHTDGDDVDSKGNARADALAVKACQTQKRVVPDEKPANV